MSFARKRGLAIIVVVLAAALALVARKAADGPPTRPADQRPMLLLLTSLPIIFGEGFSLEETGSPALSALESRYRVLPISTTDEAELAKGNLLLMAQPIAQVPENLVSLDKWVRRGGRVLLLADPMLEWPSKRPLGDRLRPPIMFGDTGLLAHWGLRLDAPDERGPVMLGGGHNPVMFISPGRLVASGHNCSLFRADIIADCKIGRGRAVVVADADLLDPKIPTLQNPSIDNSVELLGLLDALDG